MCSVRTRNTMLIGVLLTATAPWALAAEGTFAQIAADQGFGAVYEEIEQISAVAKNEKKRDKDLAARGLAEVVMPVSPFLGAELTLQHPSPLTQCSFDGHVSCAFSATAPQTASADNFAVSCKTQYGGSLPLESTGQRDGERLTWTVTEVEACWKLGGVGVVVRPVAIGGLDGVGQGDEFHAPELVQLSQDQVESTIESNLTAFRYCFKKHASPTSSGKLLVEYTIAEDGSVASSGFKLNTLQDAAVETCVLERFNRLQFPKPMGGFSGGTWPFTFLR